MRCLAIWATVRFFYQRNGGNLKAARADAVEAFRLREDVAKLSPCVRRKIRKEYRWREKISLRTVRRACDEVKKLYPKMRFTDPSIENITPADLAFGPSNESPFL